MKIKLPISNSELRPPGPLVPGVAAGLRPAVEPGVPPGGKSVAGCWTWKNFCDAGNSCVGSGRRDARPLRQAGRLTLRAAFSLVEVLVTVSLLSLIVIALMNVFSTTQRAFRAGVTQTDVLEGGRAAVALIAADLRGMAPSGGHFNTVNGAVNFFSFSNSLINNAYTPLLQKLPGSIEKRTNLLNYFFVLGRENTEWTGVGYIVDTASTTALYPLYRFYDQRNLSVPPFVLFSNFLNAVQNAQWSNMSHVMDGVVHLVVRPYDVNGIWLTNGYTSPGQVPPKNTLFLPPFGYESCFYFYSNSLPASVELELGVLEDRALKRAESLRNDVPALPPNDRRTLYLNDQSGRVHVFRQRVNIQNVDPAAYQ